MDKKQFVRDLRSCIVLFTVVVVLSLVYTFFITWGTQTLMPYQANGSLLYVNGTVVGSELIGQNFSSPGYFHGRPSAVNYDATGSGGSNYGATSAALMNLVKQRVAKVRAENNLSPNASVPADLVLASASGLDPHISVEGAMIQVQRVAKVRGLPESDVKALVDQHTEYPQFGFLGQTRINVLKLNIALDELARKNKQ
jgi:K+-transporting ATPase ATPase C chain